MLTEIIELVNIARLRAEGQQKVRHREIITNQVPMRSS